MIYYISEKSELNGNGTREKPFKKITQAANIAVAGDTIVIGDGVYREWINPKNGGTDDTLATLKKPIPVIIKNNAYFNNTRPYNKEENPYVNKKFRAKINVTEEDGHYYLNTNLGDILNDLPCGDIVTTDILGKAFEPNQKFENRDGSPIKVNSDLMNEPRKDKVKAGAFEKIESKTKII